MENPNAYKSPIEVREGVSATQAEMYRSALVRIMERSNDNAALVNAMRDFIKEIDIKSQKGTAGEQMSDGLIESLTEFFNDKSAELRRF